VLILILFCHSRFPKKFDVFHTLIKYNQQLLTVNALHCLLHEYLVIMFASVDYTCKCLIHLQQLKSNTSTAITATHETPVQHYVDDVEFSLAAKGSGCELKVIKH